jgi:hypothetical protein
VVEALEAVAAPLDAFDAEVKPSVGPLLAPVLW